MDSSREFEGRRALITGGASGIGACTAQWLRAGGAEVVIADRDAERGHAVAERLDARFVALDVTREADWTRAFAELAPIDLLVCSAGISVPATIEDATLEHWRQTLAINADGVFLGCRHGIRAMRGRGGAIVNVASTLGARPGSSYVAYSASKAAVLAITRSAALHCAEQKLGIRVNAVLPGATDTPMYQGYLANAADRAAAAAAFAAAHPDGRVGTAEDVAQGILYLLSERAAHVTGVSLPVDGGFLAR